MCWASLALLILVWALTILLFLLIFSSVNWAPLDFFDLGFYTRYWKIWCNMDSMVYRSSHRWWFYYIFQEGKGKSSFIWLVFITMHMRVLINCESINTFKQSILDIRKSVELKIYLRLQQLSFIYQYFKIKMMYTCILMIQSILLIIWDFLVLI